MSLDIATFEGQAGKIRYGVCGKEDALGYVVFANGRTEWMEKYLRLRSDLSLPERWGFVTFDHYGQGGSEGIRGHVDRYDVFCRDMQSVIQRCVGDKPYVVLAHSMGALVSLVATMRLYISPQAMVLCSPLLGMPNKPIPPVIASKLSALLNILGLAKIHSDVIVKYNMQFEKNPLTQDRGMFEIIEKTPYPVPAPTFGWIYQTFKILGWVHNPQNLARISCPIRLICPVADTVVDPLAAERWKNALDGITGHKPPIDIKHVANAKHELLAETPEYYHSSLTYISEWFSPFFQNNLAKNQMI